jgi:hypothetical protein
MTPPEQAGPTSPSTGDAQATARRPSAEGQESTGGPTGQSTTTPKGADGEDVVRGRQVEGQSTGEARHPSEVNR